MKARRFPAANKVFELPGGTEDNSLWVEVGVARDEILGEQPFVRSLWVPDEEERRRIAAGENISLTTLGSGTPPLLMEVTDEQAGRLRSTDEMLGEDG